VGIAAAAFGAHGLEKVASPEQIRWWAIAAAIQLVTLPVVLICAARTDRFRPSGGAPTELIAPARAYPTGFVVDCGGCDSVIDGDVVTLVTAPPLVGDEATVTIRPAP
jgi:hypothetical protein